MKIKNGFAKRNVAGSNIVVPVGKNSLDFNGMLTLNESASFFWDCMLEETTIEQVVKKVMNEYDIDESSAKEDVESFIDLLKKNNILD